MGKEEQKSLLKFNKHCLFTLTSDPATLGAGP